MNIGYRTISYFKNRPRISKLVQTFYFIIIFLNFILHLFFNLFLLMQLV